MKASLASAFFLLAVAPFAVAQDPTPQSRSFGMEAKSVATGGIIADNNSVSKVDGVDRDGSTHTAFTSINKRDANHGVTIEVSVRNFSRDYPGTPVAEWIFFAKPADRGTGEEYIFSSGTQGLQITPSGSDRFQVKSPAIRSHAKTTVSGANPSGSNPGNVYYVPVVSSEVSGDKLTGWVVRLLMDGKVVGAKGSSRRYEDIARNEGLVGKMKEAANCEK